MVMNTFLPNSSSFTLNWSDETLIWWWSDYVKWNIHIQRHFIGIEIEGSTFWKLNDFVYPRLSMFTYKEICRTEVGNSVIRGNKV